MAKKTAEVQVINNTKFSLDVIKELSYIGMTVNKWRGRNIKLYKHPTDEDRLVSGGCTFDGSKIIICDEERKDYATALDYILHGKNYTSE